MEISGHLFPEECGGPPCPKVFFEEEFPTDPSDFCFGAISRGGGDISWSKVPRQENARFDESSVPLEVPETSLISQEFLGFLQQKICLQRRGGMGELMLP